MGNVNIFLIIIKKVDFKVISYSPFFAVAPQVLEMKGRLEKVRFATE